MREGIGTGFGRARHPDAAHEIALKGAETDATKRALATFGNPFGLALYDKDQAGVTRPPAHASPPTGKPYVLFGADGSRLSLRTTGALSDAAFEVIRRLESMDAIYKFWKKNHSTFVQLKSTAPDGAMLIEAIISALEVRSRFLSSTAASNSTDRADPIKQGILTFPKERRARNKLHLRFVARSHA
jgi:hypothetical protein